jgi:hypothetical protein
MKTKNDATSINMIHQLLTSTNPRQQWQIFLKKNGMKRVLLMAAPSYVSGSNRMDLINSIEF